MLSNRYSKTDEEESLGEGRRETAQELVATGTCSPGRERLDKCKRREVNLKSNENSEQS